MTAYVWPFLGGVLAVGLEVWFRLGKPYFALPQLPFILLASITLNYCVYRAVVGNGWLTGLLYFNMATLLLRIAAQFVISGGTPHRGEVIAAVALLAGVLARLLSK